MSTATTTAANHVGEQKRSLTNPPEVIIRPLDGKVVFFPKGIFSKGYIVGNPEQEHRIREAVSGFRTTSMSFICLIACPAFVSSLLILFGFPFIVGPFMGAAVALLVFSTIAFFVPWMAWFKLSQRKLERLAAGLEETEAFETKTSKEFTFQFLPSLTVLTAIGVWGIISIWPLIHGYGPVPMPTKNSAVLFFPDRLAFLAFAILLFVSSYFFVTTKQPIPEGKRSLVGVLSFIMAIVALIASMGSSPNIVVSTDALHCVTYTVKWNDITEIKLQQTRLYKMSAVLFLDPRYINDNKWTDYIRHRGAVNCPLSYENRYYRVIYDSIYLAWRDARTRS